MRLWVKRIARTIEKNREDLLGIVLRKYPAFILRDNITNLDDVPVFVFHDVTAESLAPLCEFLAENGYTTLTADEYVGRTVAGERRHRREVLLTFDDGLRSLYTAAYPALRRYGMKAVAYIIPGVVPDNDPLAYADGPRQNLCSWQQITEMHDSGVVDFQSHSMFHHSVPVSSQVMEFTRPGFEPSFLTSDLAPLVGDADGAAAARPRYGFPVHDWGARFGKVPAFREHPRVSLMCMQHVLEKGNQQFFARRSWRRELTHVVQSGRREHPPFGFENDSEQKDAILKDLKESKQEIERRLPGKAVRHFCFPWSRGSELAVRLSAEAGYLSNAWSSLLPVCLDSEMVRPLPIPRFAPRFIWRLPGIGRKSLLHCFAAAKDCL